MADLKHIEDFILHFNRQNMEYSSKEKLQKIAKNLSLKMTLKVKVSKFFFGYLANYILMRPTVTPFNSTCVSFFEDIVVDSIANISQGNYTDAEFLLFLLVICQEIYMQHFFNGKKIFSEKFLKFFRKLNFMYNKKIWTELLLILKEQSIDKKAVFYFFNPNSFNSTDFYNKSSLYAEENIILYLMQIAFFLLQQPHQVILNNFIFVNQQTLNYPISKLMNISTFMEKNISSVYKTNRYVSALPKTSNDPDYILVLTNASKYLSLEDKHLLANLIVLNRSSSSHFRKLLFNKILSEHSHISKQTRKKLYKKLMILDAENFYGSIAQSMYITKENDSLQDVSTIVKMDVERTKFYKGDSEQLRNLLINIGEYIPSVGYYQGLNCLGAFVLEYFEDYVFSFDIISFCLHKHMKQYFFGDFRKLNKLVFIGESLIQEFFPGVYSSIEKTGIGHGYYLSSVILTIFFSILQFCKCNDFILFALDLYTSEGWVGFFKVLIYVISKTIEHIRKQSADMLIHYMKKTIYLDLIKEDLSDLKNVCHSLPITQKKLKSIEKKYSKSRYVLSDFWNSYFKSKKAESNRLIRRNSMPQSIIDHQEMRVHSRSENHSLMTIDNQSGQMTYGLNNSLIISMKIRQELKCVQSEMPSDDKEVLGNTHNTINPLQKEFFNSSKLDNKLLCVSNNSSQRKTTDTKTRLSGDVEEEAMQEPAEGFEDFIDRKGSSLSKKMIKHLNVRPVRKKEFDYDTGGYKPNQHIRDSDIIKRFRSSQTQSKSSKTKKVKFDDKALPVHAFLKKKEVKKKQTQNKSFNL